MPQRLAYTIREVLELVPISRTKLYRLIRSGDLETIHIDGRTLIKHQELDRFLEEYPKKAVAG